VDKAFNSQRKVVSFSSFENQSSQQSGPDYRARELRRNSLTDSTESRFVQPNAVSRRPMAVILFRDGENAWHKNGITAIGRRRTAIGRRRTRDDSLAVGVRGDRFDVPR
jgi:hypothetical protein